MVEQLIWVGCPIHIAGYQEKLNSLQVICKMLQPSLHKEITCIVPTILTLSQIKILFSYKCVFKESGGRGEERRRVHFKMSKCKESNDDEKLLQ